jgi:hydrogenase-4 membrane subunit HyfE
LETVTSSVLRDWLNLGAMIGAFAVMFVGLRIVFSRLKAKNQGFGPNSLRALGIVLFLPALLIVPVIVPQFRTETLAALLGTVAGYILSKSSDREDQ